MAWQKSLTTVSGSLILNPCGEWVIRLQKCLCWRFMGRPVLRPVNRLCAAVHRLLPKVCHCVPFEPRAGGVPSPLPRMRSAGAQNSPDTRARGRRAAAASVPKEVATRLRPAFARLRRGKRVAGCRSGSSDRPGPAAGRAERDRPFGIRNAYSPPLLGYAYSTRLVDQA